MSQVNFNEEKHEYTLQGKTLISTTQLLKKYGLSADYSGIPQAVLQQAANKGKAMHKALELHIQGNPTAISLCDEVALFDNYIKTRQIDLSKATAEQLVFDAHYGVAGTIDFEYVDDQDEILADFKRTAQLHIDTVAWQLSIYNYLRCGGDMIKYYFKKLKVFHFTRGRLYVKDIYTVDYDAVKSLFEAHLRRDTTFNYIKPNNIISPSEETLAIQLMNEIKNAEDFVKKLKGELNIVLDKVKENFVKNKEYKYKTTAISLSYTAPQHRSSLNQKKAKEFIEQHGGKVEDFMNHTVTKDGVRAKLVKAPDAVSAAMPDETESAVGADDKQ